MKTILLASLLSVADLVLPCAHAQQVGALFKQFLETKAKAEQGDAVAESNLGLCYMQGRGVAKDYAEAVKWYRKAAEQNLAWSQFNLGVCYHQGRGVEKDAVAAVNWVRRAAEQNYGDAQHNLGISYHEGVGVKQDYVEAVKWFRKAAEQDIAEAQFNLGRCHITGAGVKPDDVEAYAWFSLAARAMEQAQKNRENLEKRMTPEQIYDGSKRMRELRAQIEARLESAGKAQSPCP